MSSKKFWTPPKLAKVLNTTADNVVNNWIKNGHLVAHNIATPGSKKPRWQIADEEVDRFLAARASAPPAASTRRRKSKERIEQYV